MGDEKDLATQPIYNIRSVAEKTGISPETMRAWERRYGFPSPYRNPKGYRLYSSDEIAALHWLKRQTDSGMTIAQAIQLLREMRASGLNPAQMSEHERLVATSPHRSADEIKNTILEAFLHLDEPVASQAILVALDQHPLNVVTMEILAPVMTRIGELWHEGDIPVAVEHFSTQICQTHLYRILQNGREDTSKGRIITACAPGEWHEIGMLIMTLLLQEAGWSVTYLGPNLSLERFGEVVEQIKPQLVLFSATSPLTAENLKDLAGLLAELPDPKPLLGLGGQAFLFDPTLANQIPGTVFGPDAIDAVRQIDQMLSKMLAHTESGI